MDIKPNDHEISMFAKVCETAGLNPFMNQIYLMRVQGKLCNYISIDGARLIASRHDTLDGYGETLWLNSNSQWVDVWTEKGYPLACKVYVYKKGAQHPFIGLALWNDYVKLDKSGKVSYMWNKMPSLMIAKCAEMIALRKVCPAELSGIYEKSELDKHSEVQDVDYVVEPLSKPIKITQNATTATTATTKIEIREGLVTDATWNKFLKLISVIPADKVKIAHERYESGLLLESDCLKFIDKYKDVKHSAVPQKVTDPEIYYQNANPDGIIDEIPF
jgi:phage recombination protein Bet